MQYHIFIRFDIKRGGGGLPPQVSFGLNANIRDEE